MAVNHEIPVSPPDSMAGITEPAIKPEATSDTTQDTNLDPSIASEKEIAPHLESISRGIINAINTRNFDATSSPWIHVANSIETNRDSGPKGSRTVTKADLLAVFSWLGTEFPDYRIEIDSVSVVVHKAFVWSRKGCTAEVFINAQATGGPGFPLGVQRKYVNVFEFKFGEGRWLAVRETLIDGMGDFMVPA
ncbi:hypothetical protein CLAFUW4_06829 [Fulvia fulva]|uniref:SnoaL-like domain-containing protein n=1 Tax=Passalora fulva TaxID=5499 RepID=A0A9Q8UQI1_PASFU|nr:uncharacterized protein CLAFUR5_06965 [Fulvia fulva]KAK4621739.1 hypothetical protein CLAFUR4_06837 [Fulvia fulva]KAK4623420.1 hypothetical protein CLAFUR0_06832 [Fulvia fulva]UJO18788.1 hypothetical protein CLAFUR5_06965 [Fulvia fulva]WPV16577.1 hypothetical protein CLAFUW4_06829 [Fulvia fulva]WPV30799.1 hypothetical protein CLAFUW7_06828 [Fulvia fulva]